MDLYVVIGIIHLCLDYSDYSKERQNSTPRFVSFRWRIQVILHFFLFVFVRSPSLYVFVPDGRLAPPCEWHLNRWLRFLLTSTHRRQVVASVMTSVMRKGSFRLTRIPVERKKCFPNRFRADFLLDGSSAATSHARLLRSYPPTSSDFRRLVLNALCGPDSF